MPIRLDEEHSIHVPIIGKHIQPSPVYKYSARWYEEQGLKIPPDKPSVRRVLARWLYRAGIRLDRKERYLRLGRLYIQWDE